MINPTLLAVNIVAINALFLFYILIASYPLPEEGKITFKKVTLRRLFCFIKGNPIRLHWLPVSLSIWVGLLFPICTFGYTLFICLK